MNQENELLEALDDWAADFKKKCHPVALTLLRASTLIRKQLAAEGGTEGRGASSLPSCPGGDILWQEVSGIFNYWQGVAQCNCGEETPIGACLKCDMEKSEDRVSELYALLNHSLHNS